jgi:Protein of unknown function (DUF726)
LATVLASRYVYDTVDASQTNKSLSEYISGSSSSSSSTSSFSTSSVDSGSNNSSSSSDDDENDVITENKENSIGKEVQSSDNEDKQKLKCDKQRPQEDPAKPTVTPIPPRRGFRRSGTTNNNQTSRVSVRRTSSMSILLQQQQALHRKRRHEVLSELLVSGAKLLQLSNDEVGSFYVPLLDRILNVPTSEQPKTLVTDSNPNSSTLSNPSNNNKNLVDEINKKVDEIDNLRTFLEDLTFGSGVPCLVMFLLQYLLTHKGYDARVRHSIKTLGVILIMKEMCSAYNDDLPISPVKFATLKFEAIERVIAQKLLHLPNVKTLDDETQQASNNNQHRRNLFMKGVKIGSVAVTAGVLFAVTAGMAAPAIAAGVAAVAGGTAMTATAAALLTSHVAVTAIFGVGGGSLAAYKMNRRVSGLTEFEIRKENDTTTPEDTTSTSQTTTESNKMAESAELFRTVCVSGWLQDDKDYQRPWGVTPTKPPITNRVELLERFYSVFNREKVQQTSSRRMQKEYKNEKWPELCKHLESMYGRNPESLFPLPERFRLNNSSKLSHKEVYTIDGLFFDLGLATNPPIDQHQASETLTEQWCDYIDSEMFNTPLSSSLLNDDTTPAPAEWRRSRADSTDSVTESNEESNFAEYDAPKHVSTVWDYQSTYGGEMYTVLWESTLLKNVSDSMSGFGVEFLMQRGATEILKHTVLATLVTALAVPAVLAAATNVIDGPWTLTSERADEAGKELARSLLASTSGNRPVSLVGFSFGARIVYACLKELHSYQQLWEANRGTETTVTESLHTRALLRRRTSGLLPIEMTREPASIVEDVIMLGLPVRLDIPSWIACRQVVAGRIVHGYAQNDWVLSLMYKVKQVGIKTGKSVRNSLYFQKYNHSSNNDSLLTSQKCVEHLLSEFLELKI